MSMHVYGGLGLVFTLFTLNKLFAQAKYMVQDTKMGHFNTLYGVRSHNGNLLFIDVFMLYSFLNLFYILFLYLKYKIFKHFSNI